MSGFTDNWPYSDLHNLNLDWIIEKIQAFETLSNTNTVRIESALTTVEEKVNYIDNFFNNLDVQEEINEKLDQMDEAGDLARILQPFAESYLSDTAPNIITSWLQTNITPTTPAIDASLSVFGAAADAKSAGDAIRASRDAITGEKYNPVWVTGGFLNANGNLAENANFSYTEKIPISDIVKIEVFSIGSANLSNIVFYKNDAVWGVVTGTGQDLTACHVTGYPPAETTHFALSKYNQAAVETYCLEREHIIDTYESIFDRTCVLGYINPYGAVTKEFISKYFNVSPLIKLGNTKRVSFALPVITNMLAVAFYDANKIYISGASAQSATPIILQDIINVPANAVYMAFCYVNATYATEIDFSECYVTLIPNYYADFINKTWMAIGDSITVGETNNSISYVDYLSSHINASKQATSGATMLALYQNRNNYPANADIITIFAGTNDFAINRPLGTIANTETSETSLTFYGEVQQFMKWAQENYPHTPIIFVTPTWRQDMINGNGNNLKDFANVIIDCGRVHGVPVIDITSDSGIGEYNINTYTSDGLHPNQYGQKLLASVFKHIIDKYIGAES